MISTAKRDLIMEAVESTGLDEKVIKVCWTITEQTVIHFKYSVFFFAG